MFQTAEEMKEFLLLDEEIIVHLQKMILKMFLPQDQKLYLLSID